MKDRLHKAERFYFDLCDCVVNEELEDRRKLNINVRSVITEATLLQHIPFLHCRDYKTTVIHSQIKPQLMFHCVLISAISSLTCIRVELHIHFNI